MQFSLIDKIKKQQEEEEKKNRLLAIKGTKNA